MARLPGWVDLLQGKECLGANSDGLARLDVAGFLLLQGHRSELRVRDGPLHVEIWGEGDEISVTSGRTSTVLRIIEQFEA